MLTQTQTRRGLALLCAVAASVALTACGSASATGGRGSGKSPAAEAQAGFASLADGHALTATVKLDADKAALSALTGGSTGGAGIASLAGGTIVIAAKTGGGAFRDQTSTDGTSFAVTINAATTPNLLQVVSVSRTLYVRADLAKLLGQSGSPLAGLPSAGDLPPQLSFVKSLLAGGWLKISLSDLASSLGTAAPSVAPSRAADFSAALTKIFRDDVAVTRAAADQQPGAQAADQQPGAHLVLSGNARKVGGDLIAAVKNLAGGGAMRLFDAFKPSTLPDKTIKVDEYVNDGTVSAVRLDLTQLSSAPKATGKPATLAVTLSPTATITAPETAVSVDVGALGPLLGGLLGGAGGASPSPAA